MSDIFFSFNGREIEIVSSYVYLGVTMSSSTWFRMQMEKAKLKAKRVLQMVLKLIFKTRLANFHGHYTLFESIIKSTLLYGCSVWAHRYKEKPEPVQNIYYRRLLGLHPQLSSAVVRCETASQFLEISVWEQTINFIRKIKIMDNKRYAKLIFDRLVLLDAPSLDYNWVTQVRRGLTSFGLGDFITLNPEEYLTYCAAAHEVIVEPFREHDEYLTARLYDYPQYSQLFVYEKREQIGTTEANKESRRWPKLPWYLKTELSLQIKRIIAQLRQGGVHIMCNGTVVSIPHKKEDAKCSFCSLDDRNCPQHAMFECPITAVTALTLQRHGWKPSKFMEFLDVPSKDPHEVHKLLMQCVEMRRLMCAEASTH